MIAAEIARMLNARRVGRERWLPKCPAHPDRNPSLSIAQGRTCVLFKCWSQECSVKDICAALGLRVSNLFDRESISTRAFDLATLKRLERNEAMSQGRREARELTDRARKLAMLVDAMADRLVRLPENSPANHPVAVLFHRAVEQLRDAEGALEVKR